MLRSFDRYELYYFSPWRRKRLYMKKTLLWHFRRELHPYSRVYSSPNRYGLDPKLFYYLLNLDRLFISPLLNYLYPKPGVRYIWCLYLIDAFHSLIRVFILNGYVYVERLWFCLLLVTILFIFYSGWFHKLFRPYKFLFW